MKTPLKSRTITEDVKKQFRDRAQRFEDSARWITDKELLLLHTKLLSATSASKVLDVCCGTGLVGKAFAGKVHSVAGVDISDMMLRKASERLDLCIHASAEALPFVDGSFDRVVCRQALHFLEVAKAVREMYRVCRPGGRVLISQIVPCGKEDKAWLFKIHRLKQPLLKNFLDETDIARSMKAAGFAGLEKTHFSIEENIDDWLKHAPELTRKKIAGVKALFRSAPKAYTAAHKTRIMDTTIYDTMRWVMLLGKKPAQVLRKSPRCRNKNQ